ncbi:Four F5 [Cordyceps militaris]|uniref:Four F5 n=1 Tax=Cordyceps militaris TaxID=73501 RepID=A0A2H4SMQ6_CORMI|nr:Four F5 [Cordyceps militaris]
MPSATTGSWAGKLSLVFFFLSSLVPLPSTIRAADPSLSIPSGQLDTMARGNQRDKAREANQKKLAGQKKGTNMSGSEMQRSKETAAEIMRAKQLAGTSQPHLPLP